MRHLFNGILFIPLALFLGACGGGAYGDTIDSAIQYHQEEVLGSSSENRQSFHDRENGNIVVHDDGKYVFLSFFNPEDDMKESRVYYYEKAGDSWNRLKQYEGEMMINKTPSYQEQLGEEI